MSSILRFSLAALLGASTLLAADVTFLSTWKSIDAGTVSFVGKKVAGLVITQDDSLRVAGEEALVRELTTRGLNMVATYRFVPQPELAKAETARPWFERAGVEGVIAVRPISRDKVRTYSPGMWTSPSYSSFWSYYSYGWSSYYIPGVDRVDTVVVVETLVFSVTSNALLWAGVTETKNPRDLQRFVQDLVTATAKEMQKQGLAKVQAR